MKLKEIYQDYLENRRPGSIDCLSIRYGSNRAWQNRIDLDGLKPEQRRLILEADLIQWGKGKCEYTNVALSGKDAGGGWRWEWWVEIDQDQAEIALGFAPKAKPAAKPKAKAGKRKRFTL